MSGPGDDGVRRAERAMIEGIDWIGAVVAHEAIECGWVKGGAYRVATSAPQLVRARAGLEGKRARGYTTDDAWFVTRDEIEAEVRIAGVLGGTYTPHCARTDPARLARGLAEACERLGVVDLRAVGRTHDRAGPRHVPRRVGSRGRDRARDGGVHDAPAR